ncbi:394_t:CDS:2 [Dentiscutata erythropus]|uniref:394_t:CDS:1 n=1 Tax=Dentiscutata erythropus TaxID=1348616 RepID=A0A9N9CB37_9GLOM|nr:394_t:CDS:2 [Dentiscutata erythropus]
MINILASIERITYRISGANYLTFSIIYLYIKILKQSFAPWPNQEETKQLYLDLIYSKLSDNSTDNSSSLISDDDNNQVVGPVIKNLSAVNPNGLLQKVCVAIFLSLDELWAISSDVVLIASILDPWFKTFQ